MNIEQARSRVKQIEECSDDYEAAHGMEDQLYEDFVRIVAESRSKKLAEMAKVLLSTKELDFARYCA